MANLNQHQVAVHDIANKVDQLITNNKNAGARFARHIARLYKMVEDYGQALQPYVEKLIVYSGKIGPENTFKSI